MMIVREPLNWKVICIDDHGNERVVELIIQVGASKFATELECVYNVLHSLAVVEEARVCYASLPQGI